MIKSIFKQNIAKYMIFSFIPLVYFLFIFFDLYFKDTGNPYSIALKYSSILIFFLVSMAPDIKGCNKKNNVLLQTALFLTLCADTCLLLLNYYTMGIFFFCTVQIVYILRHSKQSNIMDFFITLLLIGLMPSILNKVFPLNIDKGLYAIASIYLVLLTTSLIVALKSRKIIALAMILFFFCDINVGLSFIFSIYPAYIGNMPLSFLTSFLVWIFYFPSQLLLALSGFEEYKNSIFY